MEKIVRSDQPALYRVCEASRPGYKVYSRKKQIARKGNWGEKVIS